MVAVDTIGAIAIAGGEAFTWLVVLFVFFFVPSALASAELGAALPQEGGAYVWVRSAFGRNAGALTSLFYWAARRCGSAGRPTRHETYDPTPYPRRVRRADPPDGSARLTDLARWVRTSASSPRGADLPSPRSAPPRTPTR
jgi:hypothetical protein